MNCDVNFSVSHLFFWLFVFFLFSFIDNVHYQHTAQMVRALTEAEVKFRVQVRTVLNSAPEETESARRTFGSFRCTPAKSSSPAASISLRPRSSRHRNADAPISVTRDRD